MISGLAISLAGEDHHRNLDFIKQLYLAAVISGSKRGFEKQEKLGRAPGPDPDMTVTKFLCGLKKDAELALEIGTEKDPGSIEFRVADDICSDGIQRIARLRCELTQPNYDVIDDVFRKCYGCDIAAMKYVRALRDLKIRISRGNAPIQNVVELRNDDLIGPVMMVEIVRAYFGRRFAPERIDYLLVPDGWFGPMATDCIIYKGEVVRHFRQLDSTNILFCAQRMAGPPSGDSPAGYRASMISLFPADMTDRGDNELGKMVQNFYRNMARENDS